MEAINKPSLNDNIKLESESEVYKLIARAVHDLRSPIAVMEIGLHLNEQQISKRDFWNFKMAIQHIRDITNNLFDRSHGSQVSGKMLLKPIVEQVILHKRFEWQERECDLTFISDHDVDYIQIKADHNEVRRMLSNLLNNAIEACAQHAAIQVKIKKIDGFIELTIKDTGIGIHPNKAEKYLEGESSKHPGIGLGLSSAMQYMKSIGGEMFLTSELGIGTTIFLRFTC